MVNFALNGKETDFVLMQIGNKSSGIIKQLKFEIIRCSIDLAYLLLQNYNITFYNSSKIKLKLFNTKCLFVLHQLSIIFTLILKMEF